MSTFTWIETASMMLICVGITLYISAAFLWKCTRSRKIESGWMDLFVVIFFLGTIVTIGYFTIDYCWPDKPLMASMYSGFLYLFMGGVTLIGGIISSIWLIALLLFEMIKGIKLHEDKSSLLKLKLLW